MHNKLTPEQIAENQAKLRRPPEAASIVTVDRYATDFYTGQVIPRGERAWRWPGRGVGGPGGIVPEVARNSQVEYNWVSLANARAKGWPDDEPPRQHEPYDDRFVAQVMTLAENLATPDRMSMDEAVHFYEDLADRMLDWAHLVREGRAGAWYVEP